MRQRSSREARAAAVDLPVSVHSHYLETPVARRVRMILDEARRERCGYVLGARSGAGKTTEVEEYCALDPIVRLHDGTTRLPVIRGAPGATVKALIRSIAQCFGTVPSGSQDLQEFWLAGEIVRCGTELLLIDDGHGCSAADLLFIKRLVDEVEHRRRARLGFVFLCAAAGNSMPLQEIINRPTLQWVQFRGRMSPTRPWCYIASLSGAEVEQVLGGYESLVLKEHFPDLQLVRWAKRMHRHLIHPFFDGEGQERVTMKHLRILTDEVLRLLVTQGLSDIPDDGALIDLAVVALLGSPATQVIDDDPGPAPVLEEDSPLASVVEVG